MTSEPSSDQYKAVYCRPIPTVPHGPPTLTNDCRPKERPPCFKAPLSGAMPISSVNPADSPPPRSSVARKPRRDGRLPVSEGIGVTWLWMGPKLVTRSMAKSIRPYTVTEDWAETPAHVASRLALTMNLHGAFISSPERIIKFFRQMRRDSAR